MAQTSSNRAEWASRLTRPLVVSDSQICSYLTARIDPVFLAHAFFLSGVKPAASLQIARRDLQQPVDRSPVSIAELGS
jgi:hypothetical protein